ncbi:MAG: signal peptidase I [Gaiellaceae bacterium]
MTALALSVEAPRRRSGLYRGFVVVETVVLALVVGFLIFGRAGFVGSPVSYAVVSGHSMEPAFRTGDVAFLVRAGSYRKGDVIGYRIPKGGPGAGLIIIHRIIGGDAREGYVMQGDNKPSPDPWRPRPADVVGRERLLVPKIGLLVRYVRTPMGFAALAGLMTLTIALGGAGHERRREERPLPESVASLPRADELPEWFVRLRSGAL